jgi:hypothetical protein
MPDTASALTDTPEPTPEPQTLSQVERVIVLVFVVWILYVLVKTGITAAFS